MDSVRSNDMTDELRMMPIIQPNKLFITENRDHTLYEYYLLGNIGDPEDYVELCHALRTARPEDKFILRFNSVGGQVRTGNQILNALHECEALTIGYIEHDCGSMCTFLFLACKTWGVSKYAEWFSHTMSGGNYGKECETFEASQFLRRQTHKRIREEYKYFLTDDEIEKILTGADIYLDADEIMQRLEVYAEARERQGCGNPECQECGLDSDLEDEPQFNLKDLIKQAVNEALAEREAIKATDKQARRPSRAKKSEE
jgi:ATP-dependent protease ClpP protease subunit